MMIHNPKTSVRNLPICSNSSSSRRSAVFLCLAFAAVLAVCAAGPMQAAPLSLLPAAASVNPLRGTIALSDKSKIYYIGDGAKKEAEILADSLRPATGFSFSTEPLPNAAHASGGDIILRLVPGLKTSLGGEGYMLDSATNDILLTAGEPAGLFYAGQTLRQLLPPAIYADSPQNASTCLMQSTTGLIEIKKDAVSFEVPCCRIVDKPRFAWRGLMLDYSRHFLDVNYTKHLLDAMAMHKLNILHMHLADDDGWRIEIKKYPKLTEIGAWRGTDCAVPNTRPGEKFKRYGGFFTQDQIRDLVVYAAHRHIQIMPEIDMPGHSLALCTCYPETLPTKLAGINDVLSPVKETNFAMIDDIIGELTTLFPFEYVHIGGDEVDYNAWSKCPEIKAFMEREHISELHMAQVYFTKRLEGILAKHHKKMIGWNEILNDKLLRTTGIMSWTGVGPGYEAARMGFPVVMSPGQHNYFDMQYPGNFDDPPALDWAGRIDCKKCYAFDPLGEKGLNYAQGQQILGVHGCLWSEMVVPFKSQDGTLELKTPGETADYKLFPRLCAMAETAWSPQGVRNYDLFADRLADHFLRLNDAGIRFRVPPVDAIANGKTIEIRPPYSKAEVRYSFDGSDPMHGQVWDGKPVTGDAKTFRARVVVANRYSPITIGAKSPKR